MHHFRRVIVLLFAVIGLGVPVMGQPADAERQAAALVERLGAGSYPERTEATRKLVGLGPAARTALQRGAAGDDYETALRAKALLELFDQLLFNGIEIELRADKSSIKWDEPFTLEIRLHNKSSAAARVPLDPELNASRDEGPIPSRQVLSMVDLADFVVVTDPDGESLDLRVDGVTEDERFHESFNRRAEHPPTSVLPAGGELVYRIESFNRGWARYRLLERGEYRVQLVYEPQWNEEEWRRAKIGTVSSNALKIMVVESAPAVVRESSSPATLVVEKQRDEYVAYLVNQDDLPAPVNLNVTGDQGPPFARLGWFVELPDGNTVEIGSAGGDKQARVDFDREKIREIKPGERVEIGRLPRSALSKLDLPDSASEGAARKLGVRYSNVVSYAWQRNSMTSLIDNPNAPEGLRRPLPFRLLVTTLTSEPIPLHVSTDLGPR